MRLTTEQFSAFVERANLAPSVHNTQPTRWRLCDDGTVLLLEAIDRRLPIADPTGRDAAVSHGGAIEGFAIACAGIGIAIDVERVDDDSERGLLPIARLTLRPGAEPDRLARYVDTRRSYRGAFAKHQRSVDCAPLRAHGDVALVAYPDGIDRIAVLHDEGALRTYRDEAYRRELVSWLRLSSRHPRYALDGLNAEAMEMSRVQAAGAGLVLKPRIFEALDTIGIGRALVAEAAVVRSAQTIALFHRPVEEDALLTGRRFYRLWLEFEMIGLAAGAMSVLADDVEIRQKVVREFALPEARRLINVFRLGVPPRSTTSAKARLNRDALVV